MGQASAHTPTLCARFHRASELIGRRWTGAIIFVLLRSRCRYATLRDAIPDITDRMLSERLQELETEGIIERTVIPETPVRVEYALTKKGRGLASAVEALSDWAHKWGSVESGRPGRGDRAAQLAVRSQPDREAGVSDAHRSKAAGENGTRAGVAVRAIGEASLHDGQRCLAAGRRRRDVRIDLRRNQKRPRVRVSAVLHFSRRSNRTSASGVSRRSRARRRARLPLVRRNRQPRSVQALYQ